jgi:hypothetical protein
VFFLIAEGRHYGRTYLKGLLAVGLCLFLGLSIYLFLPMRAMQHPPVNWGNPQTWSGFLWTVSGELYRRFAFTLPLAHFPARASAWASLLVQQFGWWGLLFGLIGLWHCLKEDRAFSAFSLLGFSAVVIYAIGYDTTDSDVYLIPSYLIFATWLGVGIYCLLTALRQACPERSRRAQDAALRQIWNGMKAKAALVFGSVLLLCLPLVSLWRNFSSLDLSKDRTAYEYGAESFEVLEPSAVVIADTDPHTFALWYFSYVVGERPDVVVLNKTLLGYPWYRENMGLLHPQVAIPNNNGDVLTQLIESNRGRHPIYLTDQGAGLSARYAFLSRGPLYRLEE